jgi:hypothetical protein
MVMPKLYLERMERIPERCPMRKCVLLTLIFGLSVFAGCGAGVVKTPDERMNTYRQVLNMDMRQLADDWDTLWLADRQYRLTRWRTR